MEWNRRRSSGCGGGGGVRRWSSGELLSLAVAHHPQGTAGGREAGSTGAETGGGDQESFLQVPICYKPQSVNGPRPWGPLL